MTPEQLTALITVVILGCGTFGRGIVWLVQWQSNKTVTALRDENAWLWAQLMQSEDENAIYRQRLINLGITP